MTLRHSSSGQHSQVGQAMNAARESQSQSGSGSYSQDDSQYTLGNLGGMYDLPAAADAQSEVLTKARTVLETSIKQLNDPNFDVGVEGLDRENPDINIGVSVLVVTVRNKKQPAAGIAYHTLLLSASAPEPGSTPILLSGGKSVDLKEVTGNLFDDVMNGEIRRELNRRYPGVELFSSDARTVPASFNWDDSSRVKILQVAALTAATMTLYRNQPNFVDVNLRKVKRDPTLSVHTTFKNPQLIDSVGLPKRADIRVKFRAGSNTQQQGSANLDKQKDLSEIAGFIDLIHQRPQNVNPFLQGHVQYSPDPAAAAKAALQFMARFVITNMRSSARPTLSQTLLSLLTVYTLRKPTAWYHTYTPNFRGAQRRDNDIDLNDIGIICLETTAPDANSIGTRLNTKTESFGDRELGQLLTTYVHPGLIVSLDVDECGENTSDNRVFAEAVTTKDQDVKERAYKLIYDATNWLTDGEFGKLFQFGRPIVINENNRIQNTVYTGPNGELRDGRDLDYVAIMNLVGERDIKTARDWNDSFLLADWPIEQRLDARWQTMSELMPDLKLIGYSNRVTFTDEYLQAITKAAELTGQLQIREVNVFNDRQGYDVPQYAWTAQALGGYQANSVFTQAGYGNPAGGAPKTSGRW